MPGVRAVAGEASPAFEADLARSVLQAQVSGMADHVAALAISGGGAYGAFTAGFLGGWTERGDRPTFRLVTGISTGALIAPFAFLGPAYDRQLEEAYTSISDQDIFEPRGMLAALGSESFADTAPLARMIAEQMTAEVLQEVAAAHTQGRRLYIGTTNLDADRFVVWNMGAIAAGGDQDSLHLFRQVLLASASIPVVFPPVYIGVEVDGEPYDEMHVDGGVKAQVFLHGAVVDLDRARAMAGGSAPARRTVYLLRNGKLSPEPQAMERKLTAIAGRSISRLTKSSGVGDLYRISFFARRDGIDLRYAAIPADFEWQSDQEFDPEEMRRLFDAGYELARSASPWRTEPPGY
jgi:predicted patatin/cPLA2 family phospholipase